MAFLPLGDDSSTTTIIDISVKPLEKDGLIFYAGLRLSPPFADFISVSLHDGFIEFRYNLGSGTVVIRSTEQVELYKWHRIHAERTNKNGKK